MSDCEFVQCDPLFTAVVKSEVTFPELSRAIMRGMDAVYAVLPSLAVTPHGHNVVLYKGALFPGPAEIEVGVIVGKAFEKTGQVEPSFLPAGAAARTVHVGPYFEMRKAYERLDAFLVANGRKRGPRSWEIYGDMVEDQSKLETEIYTELLPR